MALKSASRLIGFVIIIAMVFQVCSINECFFANDLARRVKESDFVFGGVRFSFPGLAIDETVAAKVNSEYQALVDSKALGFKELPYQDPATLMSLGTEKISLQALADKAKADGIKTLIWFGIGGQGNGNKAVHYTLQGEDMDVIIVDNIEGWLINGILSSLDPKTTMIAVSSKSFTTDETMQNAAIAAQWLIDAVGSEQALEQVVFNSDNAVGANTGDKDRVNEVSRAMFGEDAKYVFPISVVNENGVYDVGGRWSVLSSGIISAALAGIDVASMLLAARVVEEANGKAEANDALDLALHTAAAFEAGQDILVIVATSPRLRRMAEWMKQHTGESLGKQGKGPHPYVVVADSNEDLEGLYASSDDKVFLFLQDVQEGFELNVPEGVSNIIYEFKDVDAANVGAYFQFFNEWAARFALALGLNPVTQPWVEKGKAGATTYAQNDESPYAAVSRESISFNSERAGISNDKLADSESVIEVASQVNPLTADEVIVAYEEIRNKLGNDYAVEIKDRAEFERGMSDAQQNLKGLASEIARVAYALGEDGFKVMYNVFYNLRLEAFGLWVEEIGRERLASRGIIVTKGVGSLNQHDLLQLWGDGPAIGYLTGVVILDKESPLAITDNPFLKSETLDALRGKDIGFVYDAMWEKISTALEAEGRPTSTLFIPELNDYYLGQLFSLYDMVTQIHAGLIDLMP